MSTDITKDQKTPKGMELRNDAPNVTITQNNTTGEKTYTIHGDLVLSKDSHYDGNLVVEGNILGEKGTLFSLVADNDITTEGSIFVQNISARNITAKVGSITAENINAWNINAENINALNITAENINAKNITAGNIYAEDINAENINAKNIDAGNITVTGCIRARDINAGFILCETLEQEKGSLLTAQLLIEHRSELPRKVIPRDGNRLDYWPDSR